MNGSHVVGGRKRGRGKKEEQERRGRESKKKRSEEALFIQRGGSPFCFRFFSFFFFFSSLLFPFSAALACNPAKDQLLYTGSSTIVEGGEVGCGCVGEKPIHSVSRFLGGFFSDQTTILVSPLFSLLLYFFILYRFILCLFILYLSILF